MFEIEPSTSTPPLTFLFHELRHVFWLQRRMPVIPHRFRTMLDAHSLLSKPFSELQIFPSVLCEIGIERTPCRIHRTFFGRLGLRRDASVQEQMFGYGHVSCREEGCRSIRVFEWFGGGILEVVGVDDPSISEGKIVASFLDGCCQSTCMCLQESWRHHQVGVDEDYHVSTCIEDAAVSGQRSTTVLGFDQFKVRIITCMCFQVLHRSIR
mmetsp:Transcript_5640/g.19736  ORF Transcript_5640/g.19736 Transcript_5640/m.19736 type:complete len:210 (-) Transcript_5640:472-1101(-)